MPTGWETGNQEVDRVPGFWEDAMSRYFSVKPWCADESGNQEETGNSRGGYSGDSVVKNTALDIIKGDAYVLFEVMDYREGLVAQPRRHAR